MRVLHVALSALLLGFSCQVDLCAQRSPKPTRQRPQSNRLQGLIDTSIESLKKPEQRLNALRRLEHLGSATVPVLKRLVHWRHRSKLRRQTQLDVLYLLGQAGKPAVAAMPELREWLRQHDRAVVAQLMATLARLAPHCTAATCAALRSEIRNRGLGTPQFAELYHLLRLGAMQGEGGDNQDALRVFLSDHGTDHCAAAGRWICATYVEGSTRHRKLLPIIERRIAEFTQRKLVTFGRAPRSSEGVLAEAWLKLRTDGPNESVARALLSCRLPDDRLRGVLWLQDHGQELPIENRIDLAGRLWDGDAIVAKAAARALASWGLRGIVGLPALLQHARQHTDLTVRKAYANAATAILADIDSLPGTDAAWLRAATRCLQHGVQLEEHALPADAAGPAGKRVLAELLMLANWTKASQVGPLLEVAQRAGADEPMVAAVYSWLRHQDYAITDFALSWLARNSKHVRHAIDERSGFTPDDECRMLPTWVPQSSRATALEATAWFLTANTKPLDLHDLLDGRNTRLQARALSQLLMQAPDQLQRIEPRLHELCNLADSEVLATRRSPDERWRGYPYQLAKPVRVLAALTLAHAGVTAPDRNGLNQLVIDRCDTTLDELVVAVGKRRADGTLVEWVEALEAECRRGLYIVAKLRWPRAQ